ncbi:MAG: hypothetical protein ACFCU4_00455 [Puniceicoccaceae bacterium]
MKWFLTLFLPALVFGSVPTVDEVIAASRAKIGSDDRLNSVETLQFRATLIRPGVDPARDDLPDLEIMIKKPRKQIIRINSERGLEASVVNEYEGYRLVKPKDAAEAMIEPMQTDELIRLTTNALENLSFFRYPLNSNVRMRMIGPVTILGRDMLAIHFRHANGVEYVRYFDPETYALVGTLTGQLLTMESGQIKANGISFGSNLEVYVDGNLAHTIKVNEVKVNQPLADALFEYPED